MLENAENERDLGVWISNNLTWRKQIFGKLKQIKCWVSSKDQQEQPKTVIL
jgi:hypothetical protein